MEHEHTQHVAATADRVYAALSNVENLPRYVPQLTAAERTDEEKVTIEARYEGHSQRGEAYFRRDEGARRIEWGSQDGGYRGMLEISPDGEGSRLTLSLTTPRDEVSDSDVMATLDAIRRLVEADT